MDKIISNNQFKENLIVYTIGHSNHTIGRFIEMLKSASITAIGDVRSVPYSGRFPQFNKNDLSHQLQLNGIKYVFLGDQLGARSKDPNCYIDRRADYSLIASTQEFKNGLQRAKEGARTFNIALMCAERDPLDCHRTILVSRHLLKENVDIFHILGNGSIEPNSATEIKLLMKMKMETGELFGERKTNEEAICEAYDRRGKEIAFVEQRDDFEDSTYGD
jgi:uncharacterized protein (DUF488 family)